jgi:UDP-3-O-[3-hydroxymyristoyl] glucosamine N-acyltransferase
VIYSPALTLQQLADRLGCQLEGDGAIEVVRVASIEAAGPGDVTFFVNRRYSSALRVTRASAVILDDKEPPAPCAMLRTPHPYLAFAEALRLFNPTVPPPAGVSPQAYVASDVQCGEGVSIGPFVSIADGVTIGARTIIHPHVAIGREATIGEDCVIHSHVAIRERVALGRRVVVQNGAVIGSDGFGFASTPEGQHHKIPQVGRVVIEDDVEIGANSAIDRPSVGETRVCAGTKIDNLVQVAHGVTIGRDALLAAQVGIAGSTKIGDHVTLAGQVGVAGHLTIGDRVIATAQSGIPNSVEPGSFISGYPAIENRDWLKASAVFRKLPEVKKQVDQLRRQVEDLERQLTESSERKT